MYILIATGQQSCKRFPSTHPSSNPWDSLREETGWETSIDAETEVTMDMTGDSTQGDTMTMIETAEEEMIDMCRRHQEDDRGQENDSLIETGEIQETTTGNDIATLEEKGTIGHLLHHSMEDIATLPLHGHPQRGNENHK
jgi:hypothetical protein